MSVVRKIIARTSTPRLVATPRAWIVPAAAVGAIVMTIVNISARTNSDVLFAFRVGRWVNFYPSARFHLQLRDPVTRALRYEFSTGGGSASPHAESWLEPAGEEVVLGCKMPASDAAALGPCRLVYDLRVEDAESALFRPIVGGILNLTSGVTFS